MKLCIITRNFPGEHFIGGAEYQAFLIAKHMRALDWATEYVALESLGGEKPGEAPFPVRFLSKKGEGIFGALREFSRYLKKERPDLCYVRDFRYLAPLRFIAARHGVPIVFNTTHEKNLVLYPDWQGWKGTIFHAMSYLCLRTLPVITNNVEHAGILARRSGICAETVLNVVEDFYAPRPKKNVILWISNIKPRKRPEIFLKLAKESADSLWDFMMAGYFQADEMRYRAEIEETSKINPRFQYLGGVPPEKAMSLMNEVAVYVSTCEPEGFPNTLIQASIAKCAIVSYNYDPDGIFSRCKIGALPRSYAELKKAVYDFMANSELRGEYGSRAREYALLQHEVSGRMKQFDGIFRRIIVRNHGA